MGHRLTIAFTGLLLDLLGWAAVVLAVDMPVNRQFPFSQGLAIVGWLAWMAVMFNFSTPTWSASQTHDLLKGGLERMVPILMENLSAADLDQLNFWVRKAAHVTEYALLAGLGYLALWWGLKQSATRSLQITLGCSVLFAIADEFHQAFSPGRTPQTQDMLLDTCGTVVAIALILWWRSRSQSRLEP